MRNIDMYLLKFITSVILCIVLYGFVLPELLYSGETQQILMGLSLGLVGFIIMMPIIVGGIKFYFKNKKQTW